ncbi:MULTISPECIES: YqjD family protein [unclassified Lentimonas]|uniref:DUF883 family protein n=1 Tax=unclassified Lentimonas TaxID=2630993 RepID=UPI0013221378|nr:MULTISPECIES: DUF883 family protein [unclassified Lentimonas]CAA6678419.1 Unannotated [Lentimonas sp. CC4]CAA6685511.1 Unannotated [Lentimonas sp. CC6]CAA7076959.1 Unannotated [Lentimonas sp. CC4]CAA7170510.1 Unannotated [Lentimonas sp. CC21]CAA7179793.1 Unannotated [Lentimonas sp. CC8]
MTQQNENATETNTCPDREKLVADLEQLLADAKVLTSDVSETSQAYFTEKTAHIRSQLTDAINDVKERGESTKEQAVETIEKVEAMIKDKPWRAVGIAVLAGIVIDRIIRD